MAPGAKTDDGSGSAAGARPSSEFEIRRAALVGEIGESLEQVLAQINALNRSLEGIIEIGNEFSSVEALWSQFEKVMGRDQDENAHGQAAAGAEGQEQETTDDGHSNRDRDHHGE